MRLSIPSALPRLLGTSLRRRLAVSIALVHALMMAVFVFDLSLRERQLLVKNTEQSTLNTAALLARSSFEWVLARDLAGLGELIRPLAEDPDIEFAMIIDREGRVLAHSDPEQVGRYVSDPVSLAALRHSQPEPHLVQNAPALIDGIAPILSRPSRAGASGQADQAGKILGWARIGTNTERTHAALGKVLRDGLLYTLAAILLGTLLALLIAADLTRDLRRVKALFLRVSAGELDQRIEVVRRDELGDLMHGLNHMLERLEADEQLLRETRERLELALQGSNDGLWDWNLVSDTVYFSPRWKAMLGYGEDEIGEAPAEWSGRIHPDDVDRTMRALDDHLADRTPAFEIIHRMRHKDGGWRWILSRGRALRDGHGRAYRVVGTLTDITELKETEGRLAIERSRLAGLLANLHSAVLVEDESRRIALANQAFCDMFHIPAPPEALVGTDCAETARASLPQVKDGSRFIQRIETLLARHEPALGDIVEMADGRVLERDYSPILVDGVLQGHLWMYRDITARIELELSLDEQRERLRIVLMSMADGVIVTDSDGRIEFLNPVAEELTGWPLNEARHRPLEQVARLMTEDSANVLDGATVHQLMQKGRQEITARLARRGAIESFVEIELKAAPMLGAGGAEGLVLILHDVSETRRLMEQMSWQASHDPLTGLPNRTAFGERLRSLLEGARTAGERHALLYMDLDQFKV
ncbi:MAG: PAS domain S-box protein, partial [Pseudomonadota bacterium]